MNLKKKLTQIIRDTYQDWFIQQDIPLKCGAGCASCCSVNVKITSIEGEMIYEHIIAQGQEAWFAGLLSHPVEHEAIHLTTNGFAKACLAGEVDIPTETPAEGQCSFLVDERCSIYEARPFSCRCFVSKVACSTEHTAEVPALILSASTVMMQLLEHVAQREYWGNMQDVLLALSDLPAHKAIRQNMKDRALDMQGRARILSGEPIPGFLLDDSEYGAVMELLQAIFDTSIEGRRVEDILNGK